MLSINQGMNHIDQGDQQDAELAARSSLYAEFRAEREEILRHKWIESEKAGRDIGFERALIDWTTAAFWAWAKTPETGASTNPIAAASAKADGLRTFRGWFILATPETFPDRLCWCLLV